MNNQKLFFLVFGGALIALVARPFINRFVPV